MQKGTSGLYKKHIESNIQKLDERKDKWNSYHISFLQQFCLPVKKQIKFIQEEIEKYKIMRDNQEQIIEQQPEIAQILKQVREYRHTNSYFNQKLSEYEKKSLQLKDYNHNLRKQILFLKKGIRSNHEELGFQLPSIEKKSIKICQQDQDNRSVYSKSFALPSISQKIDTQSSMSSSKVTINRKKIINIGEKIQKYRPFRLPTHQKSPKNNESIIKEEPKNENRDEYNQRKKKLQKIRERMTAFNKIQTLFNDCFEVKKNSVQRSVSQLQSKLIQNRQQFLIICHAIGSKQQKVDLDTFNKLSSDEILTLFISFIWLNKKLMAQFTQKRRIILDYIGKLPKLDQEI